MADLQTSEIYIKLPQWPWDHEVLHADKRRTAFNKITFYEDLTYEREGRLKARIYFYGENS
jgi:hypothetical protein